MSNTSARDFTIKLLRVIGSPFEPGKEASIDGAEARELYDCAVKNKLLLFYLEVLKQQDKLDKLQPEYEKEWARYQNFLGGLARVSDVLGTWGVKHVIVKTLRPYPAVPSDIDVVVLDSQDMYKMAIKVLLNANYTPLLTHLVDMESLTNEEAYAQAVEILTRPTWNKAHISPTGSTLIDNEHKIHIDLQSDLAVSYITYLDKDRFEKHLSILTLPDGHSINALMPELELVSVIAHSVMERSYRLGEFYTFLHHLSKMDERQFDTFISLAKDNKFRLALKAFTSLTVQLHKAAFNSIPPRAESILAEIGFNSREARQLEADNFRTPHRYCLATMAGILFDKMGEKKFRKGVGTQLRKMLNPKVTWLVISELVRMGK